MKNPVAPEAPTLHFECTSCGVGHQDQLYMLSRCIQRHVFGRPGEPASAEVSTSESIAGYCSWACRDADQAGQMSALGYAMPAIAPGPGPVEVCANCKGPVDMAAWHLSIEQLELLFAGDVVKEAQGRTLAVYCNDCCAVSLALEGEADIASRSERQALQADSKARVDVSG